MTLDSKFVIALIPARKGSKGIKRKNMKMLCNYPLIHYTFRAALDSKLIDEVYLSSDDDAILSYAQDLGIKTIMRPKKFSTDYATATEVVEHFFSTVPEVLLNQDPYVVYLQPTSPLRNNIHIDEALELMAKEKTHTLLSITQLEKSPYKSFFINQEGQVQSLFDEKLSNARRQDLPTTYISNGAIYVFRVSDFKKRSGFPSNGSTPFIMNREESVDVDTEEDIKYIESLIGARNG